jgi:hypothetical protein
MYARFVTGSSAAVQIPRDRAFRNGYSELQQFAVDPRSAPETILSGHTPNQISTGWVDAWSSRTSRATAPAATYAFAMPTIDGGWLEQHQRFPPPGPQPSQEQPKQTVSRAKAPLRTSEDAELVAQGKSLEQEVSTRRPGRSDRSPVLMTARIACRVPTGDANVNDFLVGRNIGEAQALFMQQIVRTLTMAEARVESPPQVLICDRDRKWSHDVRRRLRDAGIRMVLIPERAPNANAYAERFVRSIKEECLDRIIPIGERHFRQAIAEFVEHYNRVSYCPTRLCA